MPTLVADCHTWDNLTGPSQNLGSEALRPTLSNGLPLSVGLRQLVFSGLSLLGLLGYLYFSLVFTICQVSQPFFWDYSDTVELLKV